MANFTLSETKQALLKLYPLQIPILLNGASGVGKTSIVREVANELRLPLIDIRLSTEVPENVGGVPVPLDEKYFRKLINKDLSPVYETGAVLFFDELNRSSSWVRNSVMSAFFERTLGGRKLNDKTYVVGAINTGDKFTDTDILDWAMLARFAIINVTTRIEEVLDYFENNYPTATSIFSSKVQILSDRIYSENRFESISPTITYRNLEFAAKIIETYKEDPFLRKLLYAVVPSDIADALLSDFDFTLIKMVLAGEMVDVDREKSFMILTVIPYLNLTDEEFLNALRFAKGVYSKFKIKDGIIGFLLNIARKKRELFIRHIADINNEFPNLKDSLSLQGE